jgi:hypothetical protein
MNKRVSDGYKWSNKSGDVACQVPDRLDVIAHYVEWVSQWELKTEMMVTYDGFILLNPSMINSEISSRTRWFSFCFTVS